MNKKTEKNVENLALEEVAYGTQYALDVLLELLIEKGVISEQEFKDKLDQMINESPEADEVNINIPEHKED